jgi:hypothetical protein
MDDDGFYMGELNGRRGLVPSNFLKPIDPNKEKYATRSGDVIKVNFFGSFIFRSFKSIDYLLIFN